MLSAFEEAWNIVKYVDVVISPGDSKRGATTIDSKQVASGFIDNDEKSSRRYEHKENKDFLAATQGLAPHENIDGLQEAQARERPNWEENTYNELGIPTIQYPRQRGMILPEDGGVRGARPQREPYGDEGSWQKPDFYRGSSLPKPNQFGGLSAVNVAATGKDGMDWTNDFDDAVRQFGDIVDHEEIHNLINDEVTSWAKEAAGYTDDMENLTGEFDPMQAYGEFKPRQLNEDGTPNFMGELAANRRFKESEKGKLRDKIRSNYNTLHNIGHEFGAFTNQGPVGRLSRMAGYSFGPYVTEEKNIEDLHSDESNKRNREILRRLYGNE